MTTLPLVDTHVHFWDLAHASLSYAWLTPDAVHPILGNIDGIKMHRYEAEHLWAEARFANVSHFVHVEAAVTTGDPVEETRWLNSMAERTGRVHGIVAHADLSHDDIEEVLERHMAASRLLRGIRDFVLESALAAHDTGTFTRGLDLLARRGLVLDMDCEWPNMEAAAALARGHPDLIVILEHFGYPRTRDTEYFANWREGITALADAPNVYCKISGVGMNAAGWTIETIRPWVDHCLNSFGADRCMMGTNWPVDRLYSSYDAVVNAYRACLEELSEDEQRKVLSLTARGVYRL